MFGTTWRSSRRFSRLASSSFTEQQSSSFYHRPGPTWLAAMTTMVDKSLHLEQADRRDGSPSLPSMELRTTTTKTTKTMRTTTTKKRKHMISNADGDKVESSEPIAKPKFDEELQSYLDERAAPAPQSKKRRKRRRRRRKVKTRK